MTTLSTATWIMGLLITGCGVLATAFLSVSGGIGDWAVTLVALFVIGLLFLLGGHLFPLGRSDAPRV